MIILFGRSVKQKRCSGWRKKQSSRCTHTTVLEGMWLDDLSCKASYALTPQKYTFFSHGVMMSVSVRSVNRLSSFRIFVPRLSGFTHVHTSICCTHPLLSAACLMLHGFKALFEPVAPYCHCFDLALRVSDAFSRSNPFQLLKAMRSIYVFAAAQGVRCHVSTCQNWTADIPPGTPSAPCRIRVLVANGKPLTAAGDSTREESGESNQNPVLKWSTQNHVKN